MCDVILLRHVINSVIHPGTSLVYLLSTTNQNSTYFMTVFAKYTKHVFSKIQPSSRHIPDRDLCSVHMESHFNKIYSWQFLFLFISAHCKKKKKKKKKKKTRTEPVREKFPNAEKSNTGREFQETYRLLTPPTGQGVTAPHTWGIFSKFFFYSS